ncbi:MAG: sensor domain-containing diguanylate cyclase [Actinobacteria bacterium]|nr:sensor domain-containing diguanylate cyclase [Actinomycetota bacterium]
MSEARKKQLTMHDSPAQVGGSEIVALADRVGYLQALRVGFVVVVLSVSWFDPSLLPGSSVSLILLSAAYLLLALVAEGARRMIAGRGLSLVAGMLLLDGIYLAFAVHAWSRPAGPLTFLIYLHVIAVTLLASYRTGFKIALWHSMLLFVAIYAEASGMLSWAGLRTETPSPDLHPSDVFFLGGLWLIAIGTAAFSSMNERELRRRKRDVEAFNEMSSELQTESALPQIAGLVLRKVVASFGFRRGVIIEKHDGEMSLMAYEGPGQGSLAGQGIDDVVQRAWDEEQTILRSRLDPESDPRLSSLLPMACNLVVLPLFAEGRPLGAMVLEYSGKPGTRIERRVVDMTEQFAKHAALALCNARLLEQVQQMADTDALTGIANRRSFEATLHHEVARALRYGDELTLVMFDIDHFKKINDTLGHQAGDRVLAEAGAALLRGRREFDMPARYGGEEFCIILPGCTEAQSGAVAERLRQELCSIEAEGPITVSGGVATFPLHARSSTELIQAADDALYEAKRGGRDRLEHASTRSWPTPSKTAA